MSILLAVWAALGNVGLDAMSLTGWSGIALVSPTVRSTNEDRTITWSVGGARNISLSTSAIGSIEYRINSGTYVTYTAPFSLSSGQTLGWRYTNPAMNETDSATVADSTRGSSIATFAVSSTGY